jgi:hypothetical protein
MTKAPQQRTITIHVVDFETPREAIEWAKTTPGYTAITLRGSIVAVPYAETLALEAAGVEFAYLGGCVMADGRTHRVVTIPIN